MLGLDPSIQVWSAFGQADSGGTSVEFRTTSLEESTERYYETLNTARRMAAKPSLHATVCRARQFQMRRAEIGQHHRIGVHLGAYASETAWREDHRRKPNGTLFGLVATAALAIGPSRQWAGYWQR